MSEKNKAASQAAVANDETKELSADEKLVELVSAAQKMLSEGNKNLPESEQLKVIERDPTKKTSVDPREADEQPQKLAPGIRRGEDPLSSRSYSFAKLLSAQMGKDWSNAKVERDMHNTLAKLGYPADNNGVIVPLDARYLESKHSSELKGLSSMMSKAPGAKLSKALGEGTGSAGGFLVSPDHALEIIDLMRAQAVVEQAGARVMTLPNSGQLDIPKLTGGSTFYDVGESASITPSQQTLGRLQLRAKKGAVLVPISNELLSDSSPDVEDIVRNDIATVIALGRDLRYMRGAGTTTIPKGVKNWSGVVPFTLAGDVGNGADITYDDIVDIIDAVESNNGVFEGFIFHSRVRAKVRKIKDQNDLPVFVSNVNQSVVNELLGYPTFVSTQIPTDLTKGGGTALTEIYAGMWSEAVIAQGATMTLRASDEAGTSFADDETWIKATVRYDFGLRTENVFVFVDGVKTT